MLLNTDFTSRFPARTAYAVNGLPKVSVMFESIFVMQCSICETSGLQVAGRQHLQSARCHQLSVPYELEVTLSHRFHLYSMANVSGTVIIPCKFVAEMHKTLCVF